MSAEITCSRDDAFKQKQKQPVEKYQPDIYHNTGHRTRIHDNRKLNKDSNPEGGLFLAPRSCYVATWENRLTETRKYGLMIGALKSIAWQVPPDVRVKIESILKEIET